MKKYELDLRIDKNGKKEYITQTQKRYFKYAIEWCLQNNLNSCKVNKIYYNFDFEKMEVNINSVGYGNNNTYKIREVINNE